jgi:hypothetical protein
MIPGLFNEMEYSGVADEHRRFEFLAPYISITVDSISHKDSLSLKRKCVQSWGNSK